MTLALKRKRETTETTVAGPLTKLGASGSDLYIKHLLTGLTPIGSYHIEITSDEEEALETQNHTRRLFRTSAKI